MTLSLRHRLRQALASERGMALPTALFATIAALGLGGAAVLSSVDVQQGSKRDSGSKSAIAAADAGVNVAMMRLNRGAEELGEEEPCLEGAEPVEGWCPPEFGTVGGAEYTYQASAAGSGCGESGAYDLCVVATGSANGASRRVFVSFLGQSSSGSGGSSEEGSEEEESGSSEESGGGVEGLVGEDEVVLSGNADVRVNVGTNGNLVSSGNATICGDIRHGIGKEWVKTQNSTQCSGYDETEGSQTLPSVYSFLPSDIETNNSNGRITKCSGGEPPECQQDSYNGNWSSTKPFNPDTRRISLSGNTTLTVGGGDYWICSMSLSGNSQLIMAEGAQVRFFFDTPENCNTSNQISLSGNNAITATGYQPGDSAFDMPGFFLLGSPNIATQANLSGNYSTSHEFVIYGPDTIINISGNATFKGVIAGKQINVSGNGKFEHDDGFSLPPSIDPWSLSGGEGSESSEEAEGSSGLGVLTPQFYVECTGPAGAAPDTSC